MRQGLERLPGVYSAKNQKKITITLYGSFAKTYKGHGTDVALVGGLLDFDTNDLRIIDSLVIAKDLDIDVRFVISDQEVRHPNTARILLEDEKDSLEVVGVSVGGGKINIVEINGFKIKVTGTTPSLLVFHVDKYGVIASIANVLGLNEINIGYMEVARKEKGSTALMVLETDQPVTKNVVLEIKALPSVKKIALLKIS